MDRLWTMEHSDQCGSLSASATLFSMSVFAKSLQSCPTLCDPMDCSHQAPLSMGFSRQEYWSGLPCPTPGGLPNPAFPAIAGGCFTTSATWEALCLWVYFYFEDKFICIIFFFRFHMVALLVKNWPEMQET